MKAKILQFPGPPKVLAHAQEDPGPPPVDLSQKIFEDGVHCAYMQASRDGARFLEAKNPTDFAQASFDEQIAGSAVAAAILLEEAAAKMRITAEKRRQLVEAAKKHS
jgi:hypothetical protein